MTKKITINVDALVICVFIFSLSIGFIIFQRIQYSDLLKQYVETEEQRQNEAVNAKYFKGLYDECNNENSSDGT
jgi:hypothetical protein